MPNSPAYRLSVRGLLPKNLSERVSRIHFIAVKARLPDAAKRAATVLLATAWEPLTDEEDKTKSPDNLDKLTEKYTARSP